MTESMYMEGGVFTALLNIQHELEYGTKEEAARQVRALILGNMNQEEAEDNAEWEKVCGVDPYHNPDMTPEKYIALGGTIITDQEETEC